MVLMPVKYENSIELKHYGDLRYKKQNNKQNNFGEHHFLAFFVFQALSFFPIKCWVLNHLVPSTIAHLLPKNEK